MAGRAVKEMAYHLRHATTWVVRLGDGTPESHGRMLRALEELWPYTGEMFEQAPETRPAWLATVRNVFGRAALPVPQDG